ncbi:DUF1543 domain-containing protein [Parapedobacter koreensis]|uniref:DUF1543 domain-containing protein n=1 Tax=Parapedobacter koreensis TaxID=332977 RepID=A0A1H7M4X7_9SPHI|nr:DUF1543 domain-containing protein [Parapedobacter koreensis]SEL05775.1 protein of unknown function [Parapedobacter koreensis]
MDATLYMLLLGCKPEGRHTEQHDVFFGIGTALSDLVPDINAFWPEAQGKIHIDAWRTVRFVDGYTITAIPKDEASQLGGSPKLFFVNLGGYKEGDFEEYHYKCLSIAADAAGAIKQAKEQTFWKHNISSHIDDKYGIDVDDVYEIGDVLAPHLKERYTLVIEKIEQGTPDELHPGYLKLSKLVG